MVHSHVFFPSIKHCLRSVHRKWKRLFTFGERQIKGNSKHKWLEILAGKFCVRYKDDSFKSRFNSIHFAVILAGLKKIVSYIENFIEPRWRRTKLPMARQSFIDQCLAVNNLICSSKKSHYTSVINDNQSDYKLLFKTIHNLLHRKCDTPYPSCNSPSELANTFVEFFSDKITKIRVDLDAAAPIHPVPKVNRVCPYTFDEFIIVTVEEVRTCVMKLSSKWCDLDPLPAVTRNDLGTILTFITKIINTPLQSGLMPSQLKVAKLRPLLMKPFLDYTQLSNYRIVSNLTFTSKATEKSVANQLISYINTKQS